MNYDRPLWEHGSSFHFPDLDSFSNQRSSIGISGTLVGSGRIALKTLLWFGHQNRGWQRIWIPSYYCEDVVDSLQDMPVHVSRYPAGPMGDDVIPDPVEGDVLLRVSYFGWGMNDLQRDFAGDIIEDHTHHPMGGLKSTADFAFASLRKTLPLPDGGMLWSPRGHDVPVATDMHPVHDEAVNKRLAAMLVKQAYFQGSDVDKETYRKLDLQSEELMLQGNLSGISVWSRTMLERLPLNFWHKARLCNYVAFKGAISASDKVSIIGPKTVPSPTVALIQLPSRKIRDLLRQRLINEKIYTAVLWPGPTTDAPWYRAEDMEFSNTTLAIHVDARYSEADMQKVAERIVALTSELITSKQDI